MQREAQVLPYLAARKAQAQGGGQAQPQPDSMQSTDASAAHI